jgi:hypothetical protein
VDDVELAEDGGGVGGEDHLGEMVDDDLVAAVGTERGLDGRGDGAAGIDVSEDGAIFGIVAGGQSGEVVTAMVTVVAGRTVDGGVKRQDLLVVALLEQASVRRIGDI